MPQYTSKQVCEITGCTHRQLQYWEIKGYLTPTLGPRNVREYNDNDLQIVKRIIDYKRSGKSLGEAFVTSDLELTQSSPKIQSTHASSHPLEVDWLNKNQELLTLLDKIHTLESSLPQFPYTVYRSDQLEQLKTLQQKAVLAKEQKDTLYHQLQSIHVDESENVIIDEPTTPLPTLVYSIDQLVLLWLRHYGGGHSIQEIRSLITHRLQRGESIESIIKEIADQPAESN